MQIDIATIPDYKGFGLKNRLARLVWNIVYYFLFRTSYYPKGRKVRILLLRMFGAKVDWHVMVYPSVRIWAPWNLEIGTKTAVGPGVNVYNPSKIVIGNKVTVSQGTYLCAGGHDVSKIILPFESAPIVIGDYSWICANCFIKYGVTIGEGAIVGATSSVYENVAPWTIVGGNPAKYIKMRELRDE